MDYKDIKIVCVDLDGTLTDGSYQVFETGEFSKTFYTRDFDAISQLLKRGIKVVIVTTSHDDVILRQIKRIRETSSMADLWKKWEDNGDLIVINKSGNKKKRLINLLIYMELSWDNVAYIGDAENDLECIKKAVFSGCPSDAIKAVKEVSIYPCESMGGRGAVHEFISYIIEKRED